MNKEPVCVLIVEDDRMAADTLALFLRARGYAPITAHDGEAALVAARENDPPVILLDVMLPKLNGFEVCRRLREFSDAAILMLTAKTFESDRIGGLQIGADDYIVKPYSLNEVVARIQAIMRRTRPAVRSTDGVLQAGNATIGLRDRTVTIAGAKLALTPTHFRLLACLSQHIGTPISRAELIERVLGADYEGLDRTIDVHVAALRKKLSSHPESGIAITTAFGLGYALEEIR